MRIELYDYQKDALEKMHNGCILCGGVGSGKSRTGLAYFYIRQQGQLDPYRQMKNPKDLYIITTARKRDTMEWEGELTPFLMTTNPKDSMYAHKIVIDSWNKIKSYVNVKNAFFIFDEQRVVGRGTWVRSFLKITKQNEWILLSATPGDTWQDYIPVFVANGFYKNRSEFIREHIMYRRNSSYPIVARYLNTGRLIRLRSKILVGMDYVKHTESHHENIICDYNVGLYDDVKKNRWNYAKNQPIENASALCYELRKVVNCSPQRLRKFLELLEDHPKAIVFYNFDYELDLLKETLDSIKYNYSEWNGHEHDELPKGPAWVYLVQYTAGAEGWNCVKTDTIIFFSQNYSYKTMEQASGRIDRLNTPYSDLYYYHLKSKSSIDKAIAGSLRAKKKFNERAFVEKEGGFKCIEKRAEDQGNEY